MKTKVRRSSSSIKNWNNVEIVRTQDNEYNIWSLSYKEGKTPRGKSKLIASMTIDKDYGIMESFRVSKGYQSSEKTILQKLLETALNELTEVSVDYFSYNYEDREWWQKFATKRKCSTNFWTGILTIY